MWDWAPGFGEIGGSGFGFVFMSFINERSLYL